MSVATTVRDGRCAHQHWVRCQQTAVRLAQCLPGWLVCKVIGVNSESDQQTSAALMFSRLLVFRSTFRVSAPVCAGILRSCLACDTDSGTICLPAAQDTSPPPTVLIIIDSCLCQPTRQKKKKKKPSHAGVSSNGQMNK